MIAIIIIIAVMIKLKYFFILMSDLRKAKSIILAQQTAIYNVKHEDHLYLRIEKYTSCDGENSLTIRILRGYTNMICLNLFGVKIIVRALNDSNPNYHPKLQKVYRRLKIPEKSWIDINEMLYIDSYKAQIENGCAKFNISFSMMADIMNAIIDHLEIKIEIKK